MPQSMQAQLSGVAPLRSKRSLMLRTSCSARGGCVAPDAARGRARALIDALLDGGAQDVGKHVHHRRRPCFRTILASAARTVARWLFMYVGQRLGQQVV